MRYSTFSRRDFLKLMSLGAASGLTTSHSRANGLRGDILVCVFLRGGMDGLNMVVPYEDPDYYRYRPSIAIPAPKGGATKTVIDLDGFFGLHPALLPLKEIWDEQALAIIHATGSPDPTHSHFDAEDFMEYGAPGDKKVRTGWLSRHLLSMNTENTSPLRAVSIGTMVASSLRGAIPTIALTKLDEFRLGRGYDIPNLSELVASLFSLFHLGSSVDMAAATAVQAAGILNAIPTEAELPAASLEYPQTEFGQSLRLAGQLIRSEIGVEVVTVDIFGWDTHIEQGSVEGQMARLISELAHSLSTFYRDMGDEMKRITVVAMSEFGRRAAENGGGGTDHGHGNAIFVMGKNIRGGKVYGQWPGLAPESLTDPGDLAITTDFRTILAEIVQKRLMNSELAEVFPGFSPPGFLGLTS